MKVCGLIFCIMFISLAIVGFLFPKNVQDDAVIKVISAQRTKKLCTSKDIMGNVNETHPRDPKKNVLLLLRIEGISIEQFHAVNDNKDLEIYVMAGEKQNKLAYSTTKETFPSSKDRPPKIFLAFSVPAEILKMKLVVGNYPPIVFEADKEISNSLNMWDL